MLVDLIYSVPTWEMALAVVALFVGFALIGLGSRICSAWRTSPCTC